MATTGSPVYVLYTYTPSLPAAIIFIIIFAVLSIAHTWRLVTTRAWFCIPFVVGGIFETVGYVGRGLSHSDNHALAPYTIQSLLILVAPALFAASIYMAFSRLIRRLGVERYAIIRPKWLTATFVSGDVLSFLVQGGGGGIMATAWHGDNPSKTFKLGQDVILAGLWIQIVMFGVFLAVIGVFHRRCRKGRVGKEDTDVNVAWERIILMLEGVSVLILARNIVRVVEYIQGHNGYLLVHEWALYVFDASLMATVMAVFWWWYPISLKTSSFQEKRPSGGEVEMAAKV